MIKKTIALLALLSLTLSVISQVSTYRNPVISGDFPDPTVIRVGDTYYAAGTSSEWGPPYRLFQSKDLVNWESLGGLFKEMPDWTMGSYWAPELFYKDGTYYVYYTARRKTDQKSFIGVGTTKDISQGFTDHGVIVEWTNEAIDAFVIELDGKLYMTWKAYGLDRGKTIELLCSELTPDGLSLKGDVWTLLTADRNSWEEGGIEGQCLVKKGDYIYMFYAGAGCCGRGCNYQTGVARAKDIRGPWERYEQNPILVGDDYWRCSGHGTLVETTNQKYFFLYHAYNAETNVYTGRECLLDEILWDKKTGWPYFRYGETPSLQAETPYPGTIQEKITHTTTSSIPWIWDVSENKPSMSMQGESLTLMGNDSPVGAFLGFRILRADYFFQTSIQPSDDIAGICLYGSKEQSAGISLKGNLIEIWQISKGDRIELESQLVSPGRAITLCVRTTFGQYCQFGYKGEDGNFRPLGESVHISRLINWDRPPMAGIFVKGNTQATFEKIQVDYGNETFPY